MKILKKNKLICFVILLTFMFFLQTCILQKKILYKYPEHIEEAVANGVDKVYKVGIFEHNFDKNKIFVLLSLDNLGQTNILIASYNNFNPEIRKLIDTSNRFLLLDSISRKLPIAMATDFQAVSYEGFLDLKHVGGYLIVIDGEYNIVKQNLVL
ncbi:MAG: hypothetical protein NW226_15735 [Microscillaceae bacterium]|nr:hypothetical protein [Microscillaceae bacterium]